MRLRRLTLLCVLTVPAIGSAEVSPGDAAKATALFDAGHTALDAGKLDAACENFDASLQIDPQLGTRLNLADCRERQGRIVEAYDLFVASAEEAERTNKDKRAEFARQRAETLRTKLVRVTLHVADQNLAGVSIALTTASGTIKLTSRDHVMARPGTISVDVSAPDHQSVRVLGDGVAGGELVLDVPAMPSTGPHAPPPPPRPAPPPPPPAPEPVATSHRSPIPLIVGGAGGAAVIGSLVVGLRAKSIYDGAFHFTGHEIDLQIDRAERWADLGTGLAIAGTVMVSVGVYLYVREHPSSTIIAPTLDAHGAGVAIAGAL